MKLIHSLLRREIVRSYSPKEKQVNVDFVIEGMKCARDDQHNVKGLDTEAEVPPFACKFNSSLLRGHMLAVADEEGGVCLYDVRKQGPSAKLKGWVAHSNAIFDIAWVLDEPKLVTASGDQTAQLWDIQQSTKLAVFKGHSCSLKSVDFQDENLFVFATGARDGNVMVWDIRCNKRDGYYTPVNTIRNCHTTLAKGTPQRIKRRGRRLSNVVTTQDSQQSVTSVKFQDVHTLISAGAVDGDIKVWDLRRNYSTIRKEPLPYHVFPYPGAGSRKHGYSSLTLDSNKSKLFANCTNEVIYMYDCTTFQSRPLKSFRGHSNATFYVKSSVSPDDQYLMSGSGDFDGYIWRIDDPDAAPFHLTGHTNEVTSVAWCPTDQTKVVTCSDDNSFRVWRLNHADKNNGDFIGWCERKPNLPTEAIDELSNKTATPNTSPVRSRGSSTTSSPVNRSPNPMKCSSPQQFLQNWLQSNDTKSQSGRDKSYVIDGNENTENSSSSKIAFCLDNTDIASSSSSKRPRETEIKVNKSKRVCLEERTDNKEKNGDEQNNKKSPTRCDLRPANDLSNVDKLFLAKGANKENVNINSKTQVNSEQSSADTKSTLSSETQSNYELKGNGLDSKDTNQSERSNVVTKQNGKKSNWLRDMGVKKSKVSRKVNSPKQPSSPLLQEPSSPNTGCGEVLKNTKSIKDYFVPVSNDESSSSKY